MDWLQIIVAAGFAVCIGATGYHWGWRRGYASCEQEFTERDIWQDEQHRMRYHQVQAAQRFNSTRE